jgi:hypothetical protein
MGPQHSHQPQVPLLTSPPSPPPQVSIWPLASIPPPLHDTPLYYQKLLGPHPPTATQCHDISQEILQEALIACSDGAHEYSLSTTSHGWIFGSATLEMTQMDTRTSSHPLGQS